MKAYIPVNQVEPGIFSVERFVLFRVKENDYSLFVDESSVKDLTLEVQIVEYIGNEVLIELPRQTNNAGNRIKVPREFLLAG